MRVEGGEVTLAALDRSGPGPGVHRAGRRSSCPARCPRPYVVKDKAITATKGAKSAHRVRRRPVRGLRELPWPHPAASAASALGDMTRFQEMRSRLWFLLGALVVYRIGTFIPVPGIDAAPLRRLLLGSAGHDPRHVQHVLGRRAAALQHLRAGRDALHLRLDHHADGLHGVPAVEPDPQGRRVGPAQADAVHALRHGGARRISRLRGGACHPERAAGIWSRIPARNSCSSPPSP